jgi:uroporphyrinogen decarboxylase
LQGNLSPGLDLAEATPEDCRRETLKVLETMRGRPGHIFNLGHGLTPAAKAGKHRRPGGHCSNLNA